MAFTSRGYDGSINEVAWAGLNQLAGTKYGIETGWVVTGIAGTRLLQVSAGSGWGWGVIDTTDAAENVSCTANSTGATRWDTIVCRRNWSTNTTTFAVLAGTATKAVAAGIATNRGVLAEQPIGLVPVAASATSLAGVPIEPIRPAHPESVVMDGVLDVPNPGLGQVRLTTSGRARIWNGTSWRPFAGDVPLVRGEISGVDFVFPSGGSTRKVSYASPAAIAYGGATVDSGRLYAPVTGLYRVRAMQRFAYPTGTATVDVVLVARRNSGNSTTGGNLVTAAWGHLSPTSRDALLVADDIAQLNAGDYVEVFRTSSAGSVTAGGAPNEANCVLSLERW